MFRAGLPVTLPQPMTSEKLYAAVASPNALMLALEHLSLAAPLRRIETRAAEGAHPVSGVQVPGALRRDRQGGRGVRACLGAGRRRRERGALVRARRGRGGRQRIVRIGRGVGESARAPRARALRAGAARRYEPCAGPGARAGLHPRSHRCRGTAGAPERVAAVGEDGDTDGLGVAASRQYRAAHGQRPRQHQYDRESTGPSAISRRQSIFRRPCAATCCSFPR